MDIAQVSGLLPPIMKLNYSIIGYLVSPVVLTQVILLPPLSRALNLGGGKPLTPVHQDWERN